LPARSNRSAWPEINDGYRITERPLTSAPASGDIFKKNGTDSNEIIATPTKAG
jgi:hypothetical protein